MSRTRILRAVIYLLILGSLISCSGGGQPASHETWALVRLLSMGEPLSSVVSETIEVRNCIVPEIKTSDCSAGTSNSLSVNLGGSVGFGEGFSGSIDSSVSSSLGIGRQNGQSISLASPPSGYIYIYEVGKRFRVVNGEVLARSSNGDEQVVNYVFNASCSITIISREQINCSNIGQNPDESPPIEPPATEVPKRVAAPVFDYPIQGQILGYGGSYIFRVNPIANAQEYSWKFIQNGVLVWDNTMDEEPIATNEYGIHPDSVAHTKFVTGAVQVRVRALVDGQWTDETFITIFLER